MPFPLAHPAVVLPLRFVPWLSLSALMIGSLTPDLSYCLRTPGLPRLAHSFLGTLWFCLPLGLVACALLRLIREPLVCWLPSPHRQALLPLCHGRQPSWAAVALSIWIGACSHILLDALTHESPMLVPHLTGLRTEIAAIERRGILFSQLLWFALSAAGLLALLLAYALFLRRRTGRWSWFDRDEAGRYLAWCALLVLPFLGILLGFENPVRNWPWRYRLEYFVYETLARYLLVVCGCLIALGLMLRLRQALSPQATRPR